MITRSLLWWSCVCHGYGCVEFERCRRYSVVVVTDDTTGWWSWTRRCSRPYRCTTAWWSSCPATGTRPYPRPRGSLTPPDSHRWTPLKPRTVPLNWWRRFAKQFKKLILYYQFKREVAQLYNDSDRITILQTLWYVFKRWKMKTCWKWHFVEFLSTWLDYIGSNE